MKLTVIALLGLSLAAAGPAEGQSATADEEAVLAVLGTMFDALKNHDADAISGTLHESFQLAVTGTGQDGQPVVQTVTRDQFVSSIAGGQASLEEKWWDPEVQLRDNLATVWTKYAFYVDGSLSHCGVDAFTLARTEEGWKVVHVADTRQTEDCWEPSD